MLYGVDTGLLVTLALSTGSVDKEDVYGTVLKGDIGLNEGMLIENAVAQAFRANGHKLLFYSQSEKRRARTYGDRFPHRSTLCECSWKASRESC